MNALQLGAEQDARRPGKQALEPPSAVQVRPIALCGRQEVHRIGSCRSRRSAGRQVMARDGAATDPVSAKVALEGVEDVEDAVPPARGSASENPESVADVVDARSGDPVDDSSPASSSDPGDDASSMSSEAAANTAGAPNWPGSCPHAVATGEK